MNHKLIIQILIYVVAYLVFSLGLGLGLQVSTTQGNVVVLAALAIAGLNTWWLVKSRKK